VAAAELRNPNEKALAPPTDAQLDDFQHRAGLTLPPSYRAFARRFGPGSISLYVPIAVPGHRDRGPDVSLDALLDFRNRLIADGIFDFYDDPVQAKRLVLFCNTVDIKRIG
jgi:hypothetical protein